MTDLLILIGDIAMWTVVVSSWGFIATYWWQAPWWKSEVGWNMMLFAAAIGLTFTYVLVRTLDRGAPPQEPISRAVIYSMVAALMLWRWSILWRAQRRGRRKETEAQGADH